MKVDDLDGDGHKDLIVVNNRDSRIDLLFQKPDADPLDPTDPPERVNDLPDHWMFTRDSVGVADEINAIELHDFDDDGDLDIVYATTKNDQNRIP